MRLIKIDVTGTTELLMHNGRLANPMDPNTKEVANAYAEWKRSKTDEAFNSLARAEFTGSLYFAEYRDIGPYWPSDNLHTCLKNAGAKVKAAGRRGSLKNAVAASLINWEDEVNPLVYAGYKGSIPRDLNGLWETESYRFQKPARVGSSKVIRTRPVFRNWRFEASCVLDTEVLDLADLRRVAQVAGQVVGLGDWRPEKGGRRGRFTAEITDLGEFVPETTVS